MISLLYYRFYSFNANSLQVAFERKINTALKEINENEILFREENHSI
jgi:exonuclease III